MNMNGTSMHLLRSEHANGNWCCVEGLESGDHSLGSKYPPGN